MCYLKGLGRIGCGLDHTDSTKATRLLFTSGPVSKSGGALVIQIVQRSLRLLTTSSSSFLGGKQVHTSLLDRCLFNIPGSPVLICEHRRR